jgi:diguanylate cyclase (GGDEF)-like protein
MPALAPHRDPGGGTAVSLVEYISMALQVLLVSAIAFVVMCVIASVVRFQQRTRDIAELAPERKLGMDGFRILVASLLGAGRREPGPMAVGVARLDGGPDGEAAAAAFRREVAERLGARVRATDAVRWIDEHRLGLLVQAPLPRVERVLGRWLDRARADLARVRDGAALQMGVSLVPTHGVAGERVITAAIDALEALDGDAPLGWAAGGPPAAGQEAPRSTPTEPLAGVAEDQRHLADPVTGLLAAKQLPAMLHKRVSASRRQREPVSVLCLEIQHLARYRDHFGEEGVNTMLAHLGARLQGAVRETDLPARAEDDVLVLVLGCAAAPALGVGERVVSGLQGLSIPVGDAAVQVELRGGVAGSPDHGHAGRILLERARLALGAARTATAGTCRLYEEAMGAPARAPVSTETF